MTHGAIRQQDCRLNTVVSAALQYLRAVHLQRLTLASIGRCTVESPRKRADSPSSRSGAKCLERKPAAAILHTRVHAINGDMRDPEVMLKRRLAAVNRVELCRGVVRRTGPLRPLVRLIASASRDERNAAFSEWCPERRERHLQVVRPLVHIGVTQCLVPAAGAFHVTHGLIVLRSESRALRLVCRCHGRLAFVMIGSN